jgi:putative DNA primase/helicase
VAGGSLTRAEVEAELLAAGLAAGLTEEECPRTIASGLDAGAASPRTPPEKEQVVKVRRAAPVIEDRTDAKVKPGEQIIYRASSVKPRKVEWLWPARIPLGKLTTFAGVGGLGKTFTLCDIASRVTNGGPLPDDHTRHFERGQVLFVSGEDDPEDTLVPRLIEMGADLNAVIFLKTAVQDAFTLHDLKTLDLAVHQAGGVRMVVIDPPTSYLGGVDDHKNAELRQLLSPLASWTARQRLATIMNTHVNKGQGKVEALMRVMGSVAWVNAVRAAHLFARDPDDHTRRVFVPMKNNLGKERRGLAYRIVETAELARVEWLGEVDTTADEAASSQPKRGRREIQAAEWLTERFREQLEWPSDRLFQAAREAGVSRSAIFEAKETLSLPKARKTIGQDGDACWVWWVPSDWEGFQVVQKNGLL